MKSKPKFGIGKFVVYVLVCIGIMIFVIYPRWEKYNGGKVEYVQTNATCIFVQPHKIWDSGQEEYRHTFLARFAYEVDGISYEAVDNDAHSSMEVGKERELYYNPIEPETYSFIYNSFADSVSVIYILIPIMIIPLVLWVLLHLIRLAIWKSRK